MPHFNENEAFYFMKNLLPVISVILFTATSFAQDDYVDTTKKRLITDTLLLKNERTANHLRLSFLFPTIDVELGINNNSSFTINPNMSLAAGKVFPGIWLSYNYYFSYRSRCKRKRPVNNYTGAMIGVVASATFPYYITEGIYEDVIGIGPYIGWQYNKRRFWFRARLGGGSGYSFQSGDSFIGPIGGIELGLRIASSRTQVSSQKGMK